MNVAPCTKECAGCHIHTFCSSPVQPVMSEMYLYGANGCGRGLAGTGTGSGRTDTGSGRDGHGVWQGRYGVWQGRYGVWQGRARGLALD
jgi:hypothetical protein